MTITEKQARTDHYYISIEIRPFGNGAYYAVQVLPLYRDGTAGYPIREMIYSLDEKQKAYRTFNRYIKNYI